jgi:uncharacterized protein YqeY
MSLQEQIVSDLTAAMKNQDAERVSVLRMAKSALKNKEIELGKALSDTETQAVIQKEVKTRRESQAEYQRANRAELAERELAEIKILEEYLPQQLTEEELVKIVDQAITKTGAQSIKDMGQVMGEAMALAAGRADGAAISRLVKEKLS